MRTRETGTKYYELNETDARTATNPLEVKTEQKVSVKKSKLKGLCGNCDNVDTCIYSKPPSGVWHCNEYC